MPAYLTIADALALMPTLVGLDELLAINPYTDLEPYLVTASDMIDAAGPWQGQRAESGQEREFPRRDRERLYDADTSGNAIVPAAVKRAVLRQAQHLVAGGMALLRQPSSAEKKGLASVTTGSLSETYSTPDRTGGAATGPGGVGAGLLCRMAAAELERYRLRSGRIL